MSIKLRLARGGSKKRPYYSIVAADVRAPRDGRYVEKVGSYNPLLAKDSAERVTLNVERIQYWLSVGAQPTDRVLRFLAEAGLSTRDARNNPNKGQPGDKAKEREQERADKAAAKAQAEAEAAAAPAEEPTVEEPVADETSAEETPAEEKAD